MNPLQSLPTLTELQHTLFSLTPQGSIFTDTLLLSSKSYIALVLPTFSLKPFPSVAAFRLPYFSVISSTDSRHRTRQSADNSNREPTITSSITIAKGLTQIRGKSQLKQERNWKTHHQQVKQFHNYSILTEYHKRGTLRRFFLKAYQVFFCGTLSKALVSKIGIKDLNFQSLGNLFSNNFSLKVFISSFKQRSSLAFNILITTQVAPVAFPFFICFITASTFSSSIFESGPSTSACSTKSPFFRQIHQFSHVILPDFFYVPPLSFSPLPSHPLSN